MRASAAATLVMGLYANYPIALAPGMSLNAYFTYSVCLSMHVPWRTALGVIFFPAFFFWFSLLRRVREQIVNGMPGLPEAFDRGWNRDLHRVRRAAECETCSGQPCNVCGLGSFADHEAQTGLRGSARSC